MKAPKSVGIFMHNGEPYLRIIPSKKLFNSTMIHEVVTRGDFFAVNLLTNIFTILPQSCNQDACQQSTNS